VVSRAFQILSDTDKKSKYDKFGGDPDNRFSSAGASASPFSGFSQRGAPGRGGAMFEEEISPEELFRQFFGGGGGGFGGMGGGGFGGPGFVFNMGGGPGIRIHQFGGNRPRRRPHNHAQQDQGPTGLGETIRNLLPIILLFLLPLLSSIFSGSGTQGPSIFMGAQPKAPYTLAHTSSRLNVAYWVNPADVTEFTSNSWKELDKVAEGRYVGELNAHCEMEQNQRQRMFNEAQGFFFTDFAKIDQAKRMEMPNCKKLGSLPGYRGFL
jgi:DnaJ family protein B protein 12